MVVFDVQAPECVLASPPFIIIDGCIAASGSQQHNSDRVTEYGVQISPPAQYCTVHNMFDAGIGCAIL